MNATTVISNGQHKNGSPSSTVIQGAEQTPIADPDERQGWLFQKATGDTAKFNYFFYGEANHPITLGQLHNVYANVAIDVHVDSTSHPFINIYTKPTGVGDAGAWYHSRITYYIPNTYRLMLGEVFTMVTAAVPPELGYGFSQCLTRKTVLGDGLPTEEILYMTIHSESSAAAGTQILVSDVGFSTHPSHQNISRKIKLIA
tara:strand:+ start:175 stop:777 length:603 start_codon:yes stop_codon:yes gene_type:complete